MTYIINKLSTYFKEKTLKNVGPLYFHVKLHAGVILQALQTLLMWSNYQFNASM